MKGLIMATRNERRQAAKVRLAAKSARIAKASQAALLDARQATVNANMSKAPERSQSLRSSLGHLGQTAARFNSSGRGTGAMSSRSAQAVMMKVANKPQSRYASPSNDVDKSKWPVVHSK